MEQAVTEVRAAVETAIKVVEEGKRGSNLGEFVDSVLKRIAERTLVQDFEGAASKRGPGFRRLAARGGGAAGGGVDGGGNRLLEAGIEQDRLRRDFRSAAARIAAAVDLEHQDPEARFSALRQRQDALYIEGRDKGINASLEVAIEIVSIEADRANGAEQQGLARDNLGNALRVLGERESGTARLEEAVAAYRAALEERTRERVPLDWAMTQNNLGNALRALGERESGTARLEEAVAAYRAALEERTRERVPLDWAMTQNNLGNALRDARRARERHGAAGGGGRGLSRGARGTHPRARAARLGRDPEQPRQRACRPSASARAARRGWRRRSRPTARRWRSGPASACRSTGP